MSKKPSPQYGRVEQPFGCDPPRVQCPICGNVTMEITDGRGEWTPCSHVAFIYVGAVSDFGYESPDFEDRTHGISKADLHYDTITDFLQKAGYSNKLLVIEITHGGMGCGPVWFTDVFGFDYDSKADGDKS